MSFKWAVQLPLWLDLDDAMSLCRSQAHKLSEKTLQCHVPAVTVFKTDLNGQLITYRTF